jgi:hypothetical protein
METSSDIMVTVVTKSTAEFHGTCDWNDLKEVLNHEQLVWLMYRGLLEAHIDCEVST